jgi:hypothetical protein
MVVVNCIRSERREHHRRNTDADKPLARPRNGPNLWRKCFVSSLGDAVYSVNTIHRSFRKTNCHGGDA